MVKSSLTLATEARLSTLNKAWEKALQANDYKLVDYLDEKILACESDLRAMLRIDMLQAKKLK
jgi:hypothetical protein